MKSIINKFFIGAALLSSAGFVSCVGDLDQLPKDPNTIMGPTFAEDPRAYIGQVMASCYRGLAVSGQEGPDGSCDIKGIDGGTSQYTRGLFMMNEFPTDEVMWVYNDAGVPEIVQGTWGSDNVVNYGIYSRFYAHIAVCNSFIQLTRDLGSMNVPVGGDGPTAISQSEIDQFVLEARALRALSYYNVIDLWGRGVVAWDDIPFGERPKQAESREALFDMVVADLEDVLAKWPDNLNGSNVVYGRIGKDAVEGLLCRFYLNQETWTGKTSGWAKCWEHADNIIKRHQSGGYRYNGKNTGLAVEYLSLFCGNNDMFMPGGSLPAQNEILWGIPYEETYTQPYGGTAFLCNAGVYDASKADLDKGFCNLSWYGLGNGWGCMHARQQFSEKFDFQNGRCTDGRTYLWLTELSGCDVTNASYADFFGGYLPIKFTNLLANADGTMDKFVDPETGLNRAGQMENVCTKYYPNTDLPLIRLADVYLMAAECALHGAGDRQTALEYVNYVRTRAGASEWVAEDFTATSLLDERARELYWECVRRTDLVRNNMFISNYSWNWKGGSYNGGDLKPNRNVYPLPSNVTAIYGSEMQQNDGY